MILSILWIVLGVGLLGFYSGLMLLDDKTDENSENNKDIETDWHVIGSIFFLYIALTSWYLLGFWYFPLVLSLFWLLFGGIVHKVGLKKPFFYVGYTAKTDKVIRKMFPKNPEKFSMILKSVVLALSLLIIIIKN